MKFAWLALIALMAGVAVGPISAQPTVLGIDYYPGSSIKTQIFAAPGQLLPLKLTGISPLPGAPGRRLVRASTSPLPREMAGISVWYAGVFMQAQYLPILSVEQFPLCVQENDSASCWVTVVTVQVPYEAEPLLTASPFDYPEAVLRIDYNGEKGPPYWVQLFFRQPRFARMCDAVGAAVFDCGLLITTSDGRLINEGYLGPDVPGGNRPKLGDTIVMYAYGLGKTVPLGKTGEVADIPAPIAGLVPFQGTWEPDGKNVGVSLRSAYAGLAPGMVGIYQVNVKLPDAINFTPSSQFQFAVPLRLRFGSDGDGGGGDSITIPVALTTPNIP